VSWTVAIPVGLVADVVPAYASRLLTKDDFLNVFVETGYARFEHLGLVVLAWAIVTASLAHVAIEVGRRRRTPPTLRARSGPPVGGGGTEEASHE
jgi:hypothetical protein